MFCFYKAILYEALCCTFHPFLIIRPLPCSSRDLSRTQTWTKTSSFTKRNPACDTYHVTSYHLSSWSAAISLQLPLHLHSTYWASLSAMCCHNSVLWPIPFSLPGNPSFHIPPLVLGNLRLACWHNWMIASLWASSTCQTEPVCYGLDL